MYSDIKTLSIKLKLFDKHINKKLNNCRKNHGDILIT